MTCSWVMARQWWGRAALQKAAWCLLAKPPPCSLLVPGVPYHDRLLCIRRAYRLLACFERFIQFVRAPVCCSCKQPFSCIPLAWHKLGTALSPNLCDGITLLSRLCFHDLQSKKGVRTCRFGLFLLTGSDKQVVAQGQRRFVKLCSARQQMSACTWLYPWSTRAWCCSSHGQRWPKSSFKASAPQARLHVRQCSLLLDEHLSRPGQHIHATWRTCCKVLLLRVSSSLCKYCILHQDGVGGRWQA